MIRTHTEVGPGESSSPSSSSGTPSSHSVPRWKGWGAGVWERSLSSTLIHRQRAGAVWPESGAVTSLGLSSLGKRRVGLLGPTDLGRGPVRRSEASGHSGHREHPQPLSLFLPAHSLPPTRPFLPATWQTCLWVLPFNYLFCLLVFNVLSDYNLFLKLGLLLG